MSDGTGISWADATWNPVVGCTRVSAGCDHCYAVGVSHRLGCMAGADMEAGRNPGVKRHYMGLTVLNGRGQRHFNGVVRCVEEALPLPLKWRKARQVFVNSMGDLFHRDVATEFIDRVFAVMALCPQHTFKILTKRPERMAEYVNGIAEDGTADPDDLAGPQGLQRLGWAAGLMLDGEWIWNEGKRHRQAIEQLICDAYECEYDADISKGVADNQRDVPWPLPNVQLGVSAEDQATWDERVAHLLRCPAAVRIVSCEPLLGPIRMQSLVHTDEKVSQLTLGTQCERCGGHGQQPAGCWDGKAYAAPAGTCTTCEGRGRLGGIDQVIVGGESGAGARPCDVAWIRSIRDQCAAAGVACWVKQLGATARVDYYERDEDLREWAFERRHTVWNADGLGEVGGVQGVSRWRGARDGQPRPGSVIDVAMARAGADMAEWPEDLRVQEEASGESRGRESGKAGMR